MAVFLELVAFSTLALSFPGGVGEEAPGFRWGAEVLLQNTTKATTIAMMARVKEMPSTQRTTPVVSPCRALVAVSISGCRSDIRNLNATASARFGYHRIESAAHGDGALPYPPMRPQTECVEAEAAAEAISDGG